jgi:hypothetical protein
LEFFDHAGELRAVFRDWSSVMAKLHDEEHPERAGDV